MRWSINCGFIPPAVISTGNQHRCVGLEADGDLLSGGKLPDIGVCLNGNHQRLAIRKSKFQIAMQAAERCCDDCQRQSVQRILSGKKQRSGRIATTLAADRQRLVVVPAAFARRRSLPFGPIRDDLFRPQQRIDADEASNKSIGRCFKEPRGCVHLLDAALVHHGDAIRQAERLVLIVRDENEGRARALAQPAEFIAHLLAKAFVEAGQGFVEQENARLHHQSTGKRHALPLATGQEIDVAWAEAREFDETQGIR